MSNQATASPPEVVVVGSANLDLVVDVETIPLVGETVMGGDLRRIAGGKGANQAVAAARLGRRVAMVGRLGKLSRIYEFKFLYIEFKLGLKLNL